MGAAAIIAAFFAAALLITSHRGWYLTIRDGHSGELYGRYAVEPGDQVGLGFIHSVNLYPLLDLFVVGEDHILYAEKTVYYQFGAGVQTELNPGETFYIEEDGAMVVDNIHQPFEILYASAGGFSDRTLLLGSVWENYGQVRDRIGVETGEIETHVGDVRMISLSQMCGEKAVVTLACEYFWR